ncbi:ComEC family competence protein [Mesorhizobium sp. RP14(2022)]|uniref:ComEC family competence protein n=1 Tax=Mesorhizobium liriopis TaxID=2953882 RepID=A0ABT1C8R5_9HYPH|nr:ComEC/Rec2 family competence protein [Mesorhizobium liriopis]MCO6050570.1 ComEC family competence protein [Mesorhizobium liriopis]
MSDAPGRVLASGSRAMLRPLALALPRVSIGALRRDLAIEEDRGILFLLGTVALGFGAVLYFLAPFEPPLWLPVLAVVAAMSVLWRLALGRASTLAVVTLLLISVGALAGKLETLRHSTRVIGSEISTKLTAQVVQIERMANGRTRLTLDVVSTERPKLRYAPERVRVSARKVPDGVRAGSLVSGIVRLMPPSGPVRPGGYDFSFESYFDGIGASGFFLRDPELLPDDPRHPAGWQGALENARARIADRIAGTIGGTEGQIAAALVVGIRAGIPEDVNEVLRKTGLAHILSISGLHMALVAGIALGSLRFVLALFPAHASRHAVRKVASAGALALLTGYFFFSGGDVAAQRSYVMLAVILLAVMFDRAALTMRNLAIAAGITILFAPHEVMGPSFQMSFAATAALIAAYGWWVDRQRMRSHSPPGDRGVISSAVHWLGVVVAGGAATSLVAGSATLLFSAYHFQRASPFGVVANLAVMPLVSILVMPFCLLGMILMPFGLDWLAWAVVGFGLKAMLVVAAWCASYTPRDAIGLVPTVTLAVGTVALIVFASATTRLRHLSVPLLLVAGLGMTIRSTPDLYISEDAKLVGMRRPTVRWRSTWTDHRHSLPRIGRTRSMSRLSTSSEKPVSNVPARPAKRVRVIGAWLLPRTERLGKRFAARRASSSCPRLQSNHARRLQGRRSFYRLVIWPAGVQRRYGGRPSQTRRRWCGSHCVRNTVLGTAIAASRVRREASRNMSGLAKTHRR